MRREWILVGVLALAGCSTPGDLAKREPIMVQASHKSAEAVMGCISPKVMATYGLSKVAPIEDGQQLLVSGSAFGQYLGSVDVTRNGDGSRVAVRQGSSSDYAFKPTLDAVKSCI